MNRIDPDSNRDPHSAISLNKEGTTDTGVVASLCSKRRARRQYEQASSEASKTVQISDAQWRHIEEVIEQLPDIDATRVVHLHNRIMAAEYTVDSERLAAKLLALESALER